MALKDKLAGKGDGREGAELFPEVKEWRDLLVEQAFRPAEGVLSYSGNVVTMDLRGAKVGYPRKPVTTGPSYAYEIEFRVL